MKSQSVWPLPNGRYQTRHTMICAQRPTYVCSGRLDHWNNCLTRGCRGISPPQKVHDRDRQQLSWNKTVGEIFLLILQFVKTSTPVQIFFSLSLFFAVFQLFASWKYKQQLTWTFVFCFTLIVRSVNTFTSPLIITKRQQVDLFAILRKDHVWYGFYLVPGHFWTDQLIWSNPLNVSQIMKLKKLIWAKYTNGYVVPAKWSILGCCVCHVTDSRWPWHGMVCINTVLDPKHVDRRSGPMHNKPSYFASAFRPPPFAVRKSMDGLSNSNGRLTLVKNDSSCLYF